MSHQPDPVRWLDAADSPLPEDWQESFTRYAERGPGPAARARIAEGVARELTPSAGEPGVSSVRRRLTLVRGGLLATFVLGAFFAFLGLRRPPTEPAKVGALPPAPALARAPVPAPIVAVPEPESPTPPAQPSARRRAQPQKSPAPVQPGDELALLMSARKLLAVDPVRALALAEEHVVRFPSSAFAEERDVLRIEALARQDRRTEACAHAASFVKAHPTSTYLERLREVLHGARCALPPSS